MVFFIFLFSRIILNRFGKVIIMIVIVDNVYIKVVLDMVV